MRLRLGLLMIVLSVLTMTARVITQDEANAIASEFMNSIELRSASSSTLRPMKAPGVAVEAANSPYYIFNRGENEGFVIISGDDRAPKILGYSDKGSFDAENLPPQLKDMMEQWAKQISEINGGETHSSWNTKTSTRVGEGILLETANWGQLAPYNNLCPEIDGQKAPAGCVATAMAIAMKYHNWPECTRGGIETDYYFQNETFDFDKYSIDWNALSDKDNSDFANQVSQLIYSAGVAAQMIYGPEESGAEVWTIEHALNHFYGYDKDCQFVPREKFDQNQWISMLRHQLEEFGPIIYSGFGSGGHCFIVDGYNTEGLYHVNWGWDGGSNGYFTLDFSLENGMCFNENQGMLINLKPEKLYKEYSKVWIPNVDAYIDSFNGSDGWSFMNPDIVEGVPNTFKSPTMCTGDFRGYVRVAIADEEDKIVEFTDCFSHIDGYRYFCPHPGTNLFGNNIVLPPLKDGQRYQLYSQEVPNENEGPASLEVGYYPAFPPTDNPDDWQMVRGGIINPSYFLAKGNPSRISEVRIHISENLPSYCSSHNTYDKEFTIYRLRGGDCPLTFNLPEKGVKYEVSSTDKEGNPIQTYFGTWGSDNDRTFWGFNISMYADYFDVNLSFEDDGDTRRDSGISSEQIVEKDGLIYKKNLNKLILIGYDNVGEVVTIPESIEVNGEILPVIAIGSGALLNAPIKHLTILAPSLRLEALSIASLKSLETISTKSCLISEFKPNMFDNPKLKTIFLDAIPENSSIFEITTGSMYVNDKLAVGIKDIEYVLSELPPFESRYLCFSELQTFQYFAPDNATTTAIGAYYVPGLSGNEFERLTQDLPFNVKQMWEYDIDKKNALLRIQNVLDKVVIESVNINGQKVNKNSDGYYAIPSLTDTRTNDANGMEVVITYSINGLQRSITYSPQYNDGIVGINLIQKVESIKLTPDKWDGVEGESFKIEAVVMPEDATDKSLTWTSSDEAIATVDAEGNVSVLKEGTCVITATAADGSGVSAECIITSVAGVDGIFSADESFDIYGVNGILIKKNTDREGLKLLTPGIYIIRQGGEVKKIVIND